jgi:hypothetical protein
MPAPPAEEPTVNRLSTLAALLLFAPVAVAAPEVRLSADGRRVEVAGLAAADRLPETLAVFVDGADGKTAILGTTRTDGELLVFEPRFPLAKGTRYRAVVSPAGGAVVAAVLLVPRPETPPTTVAAVYPTADKLPENLLKFYLHFSAPMARGEAYRHVRLRDGKGDIVADPFLELGEELWSADGKRFTLFIDPGRIKRGLKPREDVGPALLAGGRYTLEVAPDWPDATGRPLARGFRKTFAVTDPVTERVDPKEWTVTGPAAGSTAPVRVTFPRPLDHAELFRLLQVEDAAGKPLAGTVTVGPGETIWEFTPAAKWVAGEYRLAADGRLEDVAGNSIGRPFEEDEARPADRPAETARLKFTVR